MKTLEMRKIAVTGLIVFSVGALTPIAAFAGATNSDGTTTTAPNANTQTTTTDGTSSADTSAMGNDRTNDHKDFGWIGLIGLAGLAGLMKKDRVDPARTVTR